MRLQIKLTGNAAARAKLDGYNDRLRNLSPPIQRSSVLALSSAQGRIVSGGSGGWAPTYESSFGTSLNRTGTLLRSLTRGSAGNLWQDIPRGLRVGTSLQTESGYNIGRMMQYGTGIYGRGTPIVPTNGKFLVFNLNGQKIFAKSVAGSPPRPFLFFSDDDKRRIVGIFEQYIQGTNVSGVL